MKDSQFFQQSKLMVATMPYAAEEACFALKGGTAINFFIRDLPRLSVDIDLVYLPIEDRKSTLEKISDALIRISKKVATEMPDINVVLNRPRGIETVSKLYVRSLFGEVKIEPNLIMRGVVYQPNSLPLSEKTASIFGVNHSMNVVSTQDLYGGKLCAALDRQHPRDIFDVKILMENE